MALHWQRSGSDGLHDCVVSGSSVIRSIVEGRLPGGRASSPLGPRHLWNGGDSMTPADQRRRRGRFARSDTLDHLDRPSPRHNTRGPGPARRSASSRSGSGRNRGRAFVRPGCASAPARPERLAGDELARSRRWADRVPFAQSAQRVEVLEGQPQRIHAVVARAARGCSLRWNSSVSRKVGRLPFQPARRLLQRGDVGRRRGRRRPEMLSRMNRPRFTGRRSVRVRGDGQHGALRQDAAARAVRAAASPGASRRPSRPRSRSASPGARSGTCNRCRSVPVRLRSFRTMCRRASRFPAPMARRSSSFSSNSRKRRNPPKNVRADFLQFLLLRFGQSFPAAYGSAPGTAPVAVRALGSGGSSCGDHGPRR